MSTAKFEIVGLDELIKAFEEFGDVALKEVEPDVEQGATILLESIKQEVPVRSGDLQKSLYLKKPKSKKYAVIRVITWGNDVREYAAPVELGHRLVYFGRKTSKSVPEKPFMRPGADKSKEKVFNKIIGGMDKALKNLGGLK